MSVGAFSGKPALGVVFSLLSAAGSFLFSFDSYFSKEPLKLFPIVIKLLVSVLPPLEALFNVGIQPLEFILAGGKNLFGISGMGKQNDILFEH